MSNTSAIVASLIQNKGVKTLAKLYGFDIVDTAWEDNARAENSCWGPCISDMTLGLSSKYSPSFTAQKLPLIRKPNFADVTMDLPTSFFKVRVGNEAAAIGGPTQISLEEYLKNATRYISNKIKGSLIAETNTNTDAPEEKSNRDANILTSIQHCVLPVGKDSTEFNVSLYNYQSYVEPAVLTIVASSEGTSSQALTSSDRQLFFNKYGRACNYVAERISTDRQKRGVQNTSTQLTTEEAERNCILIFQVPLKRKTPPPQDYLPDSMCYSMNESCCPSAYFMDEPVYRSIGMEKAVVKAGDPHSDFPEVQNEIERDFSFPIRCTVQFYYASDVDSVTKEIFEEMKRTGEEFEKRASAVGSLVTSSSSRDDNRTTKSVIPPTFDLQLPNGQVCEFQTNPQVQNGGTLKPLDFSTPVTGSTFPFGDSLN